MNESSVFSIKDCTLITRMAGLDSALNIREMRERVAVCPIECLYHHFCETVIRPTFDDPEFRNDFSVWCSTYLGDKKLAEQLGILNPYDFNNLEELRAKMMEIIDERLSELYYIPSAQIGEDFQFMRAVTVVFDTGKHIYSPDDLIRHIPFMSDSSLYYHFVEAHRRTLQSTDDFTVYLQDFDHEYEPLLEEFAKIDFYFLNLHELRLALKKSIENVIGAEVPHA
ncbi:MAG: hypothetical protein GF310_11970 [candidate division Zixibacteria bacterium]|nr:hypothetical protein [candidate division Zixibacteria bacterium]